MARLDDHLVRELSVAREIHEREDLLRDARALVPRMMLRLPIGGRDIEVFAGFRGESLSIYFGDDPVYHFNSRGELRRAFIDGRLVKAENGRLVLLERRQTATETALVRLAVDAELELKLLSELSARSQELEQRLATSKFVLVGQTPTEAPVIERLGSWLSRHRLIRVAASPKVG